MPRNANNKPVSGAEKQSSRNNKSSKNSKDSAEDNAVDTAADNAAYDPLARYSSFSKQKQHPPRASYLKRTFAFIFDLLLLDILVLWPFEPAIRELLPVAGFGQAMQYVSDNPAVYAKLSIILFLMGIVAYAYFVLMEFFIGQTLGKMLFRVKVVQAGTDKLYGSAKARNVQSPKKSLSSELRIFQCLTRNLFIIPVFPFILLWLIDPAFLFFNPKGQRLTEFLSNTMLVELPPETINV